MNHVQQSVFICRNDKFHLFIAKRLQGCWGVVDADFAANFIREYCGIKSRAELATNLEARDKFTRLMKEFWSGEDVKHVANA